ncbi:adenylyl-sulfate kinase [Alicyclobacillus sendaiensis]|uniref:Adenylyl-sulfate kinase n=1 Tax=Alicyclobacillus sendaiensis PA2 TaxID=3029425 RepID=A0ABT6XXH1_ALISE|nr:adenylyl-sulfate kinase [Alicyclobacillus sendaiensis]MDI9259795.1 adenylyl-sulfate kinase [Alicyclobacillus sendaiensis PA2]
MSTIVWQPTPVTKADRRRLNGHSSCVVWLTGLSGSGKSTIACALELALHERGVHTYLLDGDNLRHGLNRDLGFSADHRAENIRRAAEVAKLFVDAGIIVICGLISPYRRDREAARALFEPGEFIEVFVDCPVEVCKSRDPKGLYRRALAGEIKGFTGIDDPYEPPEAPDVVVRTDRMSIEACVKAILHHLEEAGRLGLQDVAAAERAAVKR